MHTIRAEWRAGRTLAGSRNRVCVLTFAWAMVAATSCERKRAALFLYGKLQGRDVLLGCRSLIISVVPTTGLWLELWTCGYRGVGPCESIYNLETRPELWLY